MSAASAFATTALRPLSTIWSPFCVAEVVTRSRS